MIKTRGSQRKPEASDEWQESLSSRKENFSRHMIKSERVTRIQRRFGRSIYLDKEIVSKMKLRANASFECKEDGGSLVFIPTGEETSQAKIVNLANASRNSLTVVLPAGIHSASRFKAGDKVMWSIDGQNPRKLLLSKPSDYVIQLHGLRQMGAYIPKKTALELSNIMRIRIYDSSNGSLQVTIPRQMVNQLGTENVYGVWTTSKGRLYLELTDENPHISTVNEEKRQTIPDIFSVRIPDDVGKSFKEGDRVTREIRDGKLYVHKKEAAV